MLEIVRKNNLNTFIHPKFGDLRVINIDGEIWFLGIDLARTLGYSDTQAMTRRLDNDEKQNLQIVGFGNRGATVISESGVYSAILSSHKKDAKKFRKWVTSKVIPCIRQHGAYITPDKLYELSQNQSIISDLLDELIKKNNEKMMLEEKIARDSVNVAFAEAMKGSSELVDVRNCAKLISKNGIEVGGNELYQWLRDKGLVEKNSTFPTQLAVKKGILEATKNDHWSGSSKTQVTGKGIFYIFKKLSEGFGV